MNKPPTTKLLDNAWGGAITPIRGANLSIYEKCKLLEALREKIDEAIRNAKFDQSASLMDERLIELSDACANYFETAVNSLNDLHRAIEATGLHRADSPATAGVDLRKIAGLTGDLSLAIAKVAANFRDTRPSLIESAGDLPEQPISARNVLGETLPF